MVAGDGGGRRMRYGIIIGALVLAAAVLGARMLAGPRVPVVRAERRTLVQEIVANGRVNVPVRVQLGTQAGGMLARLTVDQGDSVAAGQLLAELAPEEAAAGVSRAAARLRQVRELDLRSAEEDLRQAEVALRQAERQLQRMRDLAASDGISAQELEAAQDERDLALSRRENAATHVRGNGPGGANERLAAAELAAAQAKLEQTRITSPVDGVVLKRLAQPGEMVAAGSGVLDVAPVGPTWLVVQPEEKNLAVLRVGQHALASADAYPDSVFAARITRVAPAVDPARGTVEVELLVDRPPTFLRPDMTVSITVEVARKESVLTLPGELVRDADGDPWVLVVRDGRAERQPVTLGLRGEGTVEIVEGLQEDDAAVPVEAVHARPGARVRASTGDS